MKQATQIGKTIDEAIASALSELNVTREDVEITIIQQPKKGFLGIGRKEAIVKLTVLQTQTSKQPTFKDETEQLATKSFEGETTVNPSVTEVVSVEPSHTEEIKEKTEKNAPKYDNRVVIEQLETYLHSITEQMGIEDLTIELQEVKGKLLKVNLFSEKAAVLIGKRGQTLNSLQQLAQLLVYKHTNHFLMVELDVENYRARREDALVELAHNMADKAIRTRQAVVLEPMPSNERKIIHHALSKRLDVDTFSKGENNHRHLVIEPVL